MVLHVIKAVLQHFSATYSNHAFLEKFVISVYIHPAFMWASLVAHIVKNLPAMPETWVQSLGQEGPLEKWKPTPVFLPGKFHEQRSLPGSSPRGHKESDTTK